MLRKINFSPGNYYHIYNRGTEKRNIFVTETDHLRFLVLLYLCNNIKPVKIDELLSQGRSLRNLFEIDREKLLVNIGAYCLMPNHFHLLIREKIDNGISVFMKKLGTAYVMYFNKKNERSGNLFQGRFKAELVNKNEYLKYLFAYIHLNPIKLIEPEWKEKGIKDINFVNQYLANYQWSSYFNFIGKKINDPILNTEEFPEYFENRKEFNAFIKDWLNYK